MPTISRRSARITCVFLITLATLAAGTARAQYVQAILVSDGSVPAPVIDPNLIDPWGISFSGTSPFWISNQASNFQNPNPGGTLSPVTTLHTGSGAAVNLIVNIPNLPGDQNNPAILTGPTGTVSTAQPGLNLTLATDFPVVGPNGGTPHTASFIFANQDGSISAWSGANAGTPITNTTAMIEPTATVPGASFTGLAIANVAAAVGGASNIQLYAADQNSQNIYAFNTSWAQVGTLTDPHLPSTYTAFNVQTIGNILYATFADPNNTLGGIVDEFNPTNGSFIKRLIDDSTATTPHGNLDQPWGLTLAPATFGQFGGDLLVGNNGGDGWINAFNPITGGFVGSLTVGSGGFFHEGNLWALTFGNGSSNSNANVLYFDAGVNAAGSEGVFGSITAVPEPSSIVLDLLAMASLSLCAFGYRAVGLCRRLARSA